MGLDIVALRAMVWKPLGMDTDNEVDLLRADIDLYLNRAFWELMNQFPFREKEKLATFNTIVGTRNYDRPDATENVKELTVIDSTNGNTTLQHKPLDQIDPVVYESLYAEDPEAQGLPVKYTLEGCIIRLWPTPDDIYTMVLRRNMVLSDLSAGNAIPPIPSEFHEVIGYGGLWRAYIDKGDLARSLAIQQTQAAILNTLIPTQYKEKAVDTRYGGVQVVGRNYEMNTDVEFNNRD